MPEGLSPDVKKSPILERVYHHQPIKGPLHDQHENSLELYLSITVTCRQIRAETKLLAYIFAKYNCDKWFWWWLMMLNKDARKVVWDALTEEERGEVKSLYAEMRTHYSGVGGNTDWAAPFNDLRGPFDSFVSQAN